jgi:hypothetical protein
MAASLSNIQPTFRALSWVTGIVARPEGTIVRAVCNGELLLPDGETHYVYALAETIVSGYVLSPGMFASLPGHARVSGERTLVVSRVGYRGVFLLGGPIEATGRLRYIDGCTDSLLLAPAVCGDPCLNHLHIPAGTRQTRHTHPSVRVGVIVRGHGLCVTPEGEQPLSPGMSFVIEPDLPHSFHTDRESLDVVVYHPDSDTGPTHEDHPMKNRTIIGASS